jgi:isoquinoline 1-oxidoreductase beta subunit
MSTQLNRRRFLVASGAGALSLSLPWHHGFAAENELAPNAFVTLFRDGRVELTIPRSEMGQGIFTALSVVIAEELEVPWDKVSARQAGADASLYGEQGTGGSASIRTRFIDLRKAGAAVREMLRSAAAQAWALPLQDCRAVQGSIQHQPSGKSASYVSLLDAIAELPIPEDPPLKPINQWRLIGRSRPHIDLEEILRAKVDYGIDQRQPDMLFAAAARCPVFGGSLAGYDDSAAKRVPGYRATVEIPAVPGNAHVPPSVAVVADNSWAAMRARDALQVDWLPPDGPLENDVDNRARMAALLDAPAEDELLRIGDPDNAGGEGPRVNAEYELPLLAHASLEPQNCTARYRDGRMELWSPSQTPNFTRFLTAQATGLDADKVSVEITRIGGAFGRRLNVDFSVEAALLAKALDGPPVQLLWSREDDLRHDFYRPCALHRLSARLDGPQGAPLVWDHHFTTPAIFSKYTLPPNSDRPGMYEANGAVDLPYRVENRRCAFSLLPSRAPLGWWRAVSTTHTVFAVECFIDELAAAAGRDPLDYRLDLVAAPPADLPGQDSDFPFEPERARGILALAADAAGWGDTLPAGRGRGIAFGRDHLSYSATVVELSMPEPGAVKIHRVTAALDCGLVINPEGARMQVEGAVMQGLSAALREQVRLEGGRVAQGNFDDYPILRQLEAPERIDVVLRASAAAPTGAGEPALPTVAPALANALFAATGIRYRKLPLNRATLVGGMPADNPPAA